MEPAKNNNTEPAKCNAKIQKMIIQSKKSNNTESAKNNNTKPGKATIHS